MRVGLSPLVNINQLAVGQEVLLNEALLIVAGLGYERAGELATLKEMLGTDRALVVGRADEETRSPSVRRAAGGEAPGGRCPVGGFTHRICP